MKDFQAALSEIGEIGYIEKVKSWLCFASGLPGARPFEIVILEAGGIGQVTSLKEDLVEILLLGRSKARVGSRVARTGELLSIAVGSELLGKTIDALGNSFEGERPFRKPKEYRTVDTHPSGIVNRKLVSRPCETGVALVDLIVPLGHGQRELVIGDRKTGKTQFVLQTALTQVKLGSVCVFACIGKSASHIEAVRDFIKTQGIEKDTVLVVGSSSDPAGMIYMLPYSAMTIAEYFRDLGRDVILVLDDLTTHAKFYREIALLGGKFPGRNSYPSDIFYTHARLLERAGSFATSNVAGEASITCLVVVETMLADISGYIQTNLMSITDGHIYFDSDLFYRGRRPCVHPFLSVTRLGRQTQSKIAHEINHEIMSALSLSQKMERFRRFGAELDEGAKLTIVIGEFLLHFFNQQGDVSIAQNVQIAAFGLLWSGLWRDKGVEQMKKDFAFLAARYQKDSVFRKQVDDLISKSDGFNSFLSLLGPVGKTWISS